MTQISPKRIHVIFKTHLDVGFTDFASRVVENYFHNYIPRAVALARELRESGMAERFTWTTGSWLIYEYLEQASPQQREVLEAAILAGDIAWHALPFTTHSENMDASLFRFGLSLSQELDRRYGRRTIAAKMTDVPGHSRAIVPLLAEAGVRFLHIGVNGASTPPDVPPVFVWRDPSGAEIVVMYHKGSYGDLMMVPRLEDAIYFAHTGDNLGPQGIDQLRETYAALRARFPAAAVEASTLDQFAARLLTVKDTLPIITHEIGDSWIHGVGTDPTKISRYRTLLRLRTAWLERGVPAERLHAFSRSLMVVPEHTWGLDVKTHLGDWEAYRAADFHAARSGENFQKMEESWEEQRAYLDQALAALPDPSLASEARTELDRIQPRKPDQSSYEQIPDPAVGLETAHFLLSIDPAEGFINHLVRKVSRRRWAGSRSPLGRFWHQTFNEEDYRRFYDQYNKNKRETEFWAVPDLTKPGLEKAGARRCIFRPALTWAGKRQDPEGYITHLLLLYAMPEESWTTYGAPRTLSLELAFPQETPSILFDLQWFDKTASRIPEAAWFAFSPRVRRPSRWQINKLGEWISPLEVIRDGSRRLHAAWQGARNEAPGEVVHLDSLDVPLVSPGTPSMLNFTNRLPDIGSGLHFNLYNNLWGTNFPMWFDEDARFRFRFTQEEG